MSTKIFVSPRRTTALQWAEAGYRVFPTRPGTKLPPQGFKWKDEATTDAATICRWWDQEDYNVACALDKDHAVVDADTVEADQAWRALGVPRTFTVRTPRGGYHYHLAGKLPNSASKLAPGLDTRGGGGYVLLPGSIIEGREYTIAQGGDFAPVPAELEARLNKPHTPPASRPKNVDPQLALLRAKEWMTKQPVPITGARDNETYRVMAKLRDFGLDADQRMELVDSAWPGRNEPADLMRISDSLERGNVQNEEPGVDAPAHPSDVFAHVQPPSPPPAVPTVFWKFDRLVKRMVPDVKEIVPSLIERDVVTFLNAGGGVGKSMLALQWGLCIDAGAPIFGHQVEKASFVYLSYEDHLDEVTRRAQRIMTKLELEAGGVIIDNVGRDAPLAIISDEGITVQPMVARLKKILGKIQGHKFLVIDSCYDALRFTGNAKINEGAVKAAISWLQSLAKAMDATVLVLWHPSTAGAETASGWSVAWHNAPRAKLSLKVDEKTDQITLKVEKRNHAAKGQKIVLCRDHQGILTPRSALTNDAATELMRDTCIDLAISAADAGMPITMQRVVTATDLKRVESIVGHAVSNSDVKEILEEAAKRGRLKYQRGHGKDKAGYVPVPLVEEFAPLPGQGQEGG